MELEKQETTRGKPKASQAEASFAGHIKIPLRGFDAAVTKIEDMGLIGRKGGAKVQAGKGDPALSYVSEVLANQPDWPSRPKELGQESIISLSNVVLVLCGVIIIGSIWNKP